MRSSIFIHKTVCALALLAAFAFNGVPAAANVIVLPYTFSNGSPADATQVNANFGTIVTLVNGNIDSTNISTAVGLNVSLLKCGSSAACTIAATYPVTIAPTVGSVVPLIVQTIASPSSDAFDVDINTTKAFSVTNVGGTLIYPQATTTVPLTVSAISSQSADILDVTLTNGGTNAFKIAASGAATAGFALSAASLASSGGVAAGGAITGATTGAFSSTITANGISVSSAAPTGSWVVGNNLVSSALSTVSQPAGVAAGDSWTQETTSVGASYIGGAAGSVKMDWGVTNGQQLTFTKVGTGPASLVAGLLQVQSNGSTFGYVPPVYTAAGAALASTTHIVVGQLSTTLAAQCNAGTQCSLTSSGPTWTGAAVFGGTAYMCGLGQENLGQPLPGSYQTTIFSKSTNGFSVVVSNNNIAAISNGTSYAVDYVCVGA